MSDNFTRSEYDEELSESTKRKMREERQIVVFKLGSEEFGVNISEVWKIIRMEQITKIPNTDSFIKGVINLRGGIVVVISLAMKLGLPSKEPTNDTRIIITELKENTVGMIVDSANEMIIISTDDVKPAPPLITQKVSADYIEGVAVLGERLLILLDLAKILNYGEMQSVQQVAAVH